MVNDFFVLDLKSLPAPAWTEIEATGVSSGIADHTLSPISSSQLLFVGGVGSRRVQVFNIEKSEWSEEKPLPAEMTGEHGWLMHHRAVTWQTENGVIVFCVGGEVKNMEYGKYGKYSNHIAVFEFSR